MTGIVTVIPDSICIIPDLTYVIPDSICIIPDLTYVIPAQAGIFCGYEEIFMRSPLARG